MAPAHHPRPALAFIDSLPSASHMQVPSWGDVKPDWRAESLGWFEPTATPAWPRRRIRGLDR
ncbi:hypothetical protein [Streptomyces spongiae]|uniref:Uncharacterized protein n=1 Tax=Streptomyces spongiae TaxID=565072 RepID=A0A5N8XQK5_9ACTN|nr:hypothetical protein [Streptomyces spongiae]MPY61466.1 hypothetical protein [Streptomyces spongiae]